MTLSEAINILHNFQIWRRGGNISMPDPKKIGIAIDFSIHLLRNVRRINDEL